MSSPASHPRTSISGTVATDNTGHPLPLHPTDTYASGQPIVKDERTTNAGPLGAGSNNKTRSELSWIHHLPTWRQWVSDSWIDLITVVAAAILSGGLNIAPVANHRQFPITFQDGQIVWPELAYSRRASTVPIWLDALLATLVPTLFFVIAQIRVKSFYDLNVAFWGNIWSVITATLFQVFLKVLIGGFRPHFLSLCNPDVAALQAQGRGQGFQQIMFDRSVCNPQGNTTHLRDAMKSFPSGHTACAMAGFGYLALYFNAKMKIFSDERPHFYKMLVFFAPLLGVALIGGALTVDNSHHWYDVLVGGIIGAASALAAFRMSFASIFDHRFNHIPLPRPSSSWNPFFSSHGTGSSQTQHSHHQPPQQPQLQGRFQYALGPSSDFRSWAHGENEGGAWEARGAPFDAVKPMAGGPSSVGGYQRT